MEVLARPGGPCLAPASSQPSNAMDGRACRSGVTKTGQRLPLPVTLAIPDLLAPRNVSHSAVYGVSLQDTRTIVSLLPAASNASLSAQQPAPLSYLCRTLMVLADLPSARTPGPWPPAAVRGGSAGTRAAVASFLCFSLCYPLSAHPPIPKMLWSPPVRSGGFCDGARSR